MAKPLSTSDPAIGNLRLHTHRPAAGPAPSTPHSDCASGAEGDSVDFNQFSTDVSASVISSELARAEPLVPHDDVDSLLQRYYAEQHQANRRNMTRRLKGSAQGLASGVSSTTPEPSSSRESATSASRGHAHLPPLVGAGVNAGELERLRAENAELRQMVAELRQVLEGNDPEAWQQLHREQQRLLAEREEELAALRAYCEEWNEKVKTHRLVPADDDLAQMSDELEKERCQIMQERRQLEEEKRQLKEDEESLMKQMREMEVGLARDRAELARQRIELQRIQNEVQHELELLQRGDASIKERLAQFQRRASESSARGPVMSPAPMTATNGAAGSPKDSTVFKKLFGQG